MRVTELMTLTQNTDFPFSVKPFTGAFNEVCALTGLLFPFNKLISNVTKSKAFLIL